MRLNISNQRDKHHVWTSWKYRQYIITYSHKNILIVKTNKNHPCGPNEWYWQFGPYRKHRINIWWRDRLSTIQNKLQGVCK